MAENVAMTSTTEHGTDRAAVVAWLGGTYGSDPRFDPDAVITKAISYNSEDVLDSVLDGFFSDRALGHIGGRYASMARQVTADDLKMVTAADVRRVTKGGRLYNRQAARVAAQACPPQMQKELVLAAAYFVAGAYTRDYGSRAARRISHRATEGREYVAATSRNLRGRTLNATLDEDRDNEDVANDVRDLSGAHAHSNGGARAHSRGKRGTKRKAAVAMAGLFDI